jgi:hypothetical protein
MVRRFMARDFSRRRTFRVIGLMSHTKKQKRTVVKLEVWASWGAAVLRPYMILPNRDLAESRSWRIMMLLNRGCETAVSYVLARITP